MTPNGRSLLRRLRPTPSGRADSRAARSDEPILTAIGGRQRKKLLVRLGLAGIVGSVALFVVVTSAGIMASITQAEETSEIFTEAAELPPDLIDAVTWHPDGEDLPREMEPLTREAVTAAWLRGWEQLRIVAETGDTSGVEVNFSNSARRGVLEQADNWNGRSVQQLGHDLALTFYSEDGQVVGLRAVESRLKRTKHVGEVKLGRETEERYDAVLILEDGNWRIQHWVRRSFAGEPWVVETLDPGRVAPVDH